MAKACTEGQWEEVGALSPGRNRASYKLKEFAALLHGHNYKQEQAELTKDIRQLSGLRFAREPDAQMALTRFLQEKTDVLYPLSGTVTAVLEKEKRATRGRPAKGEVPQYQSITPST